MNKIIKQICLMSCVIITMYFCPIQVSANGITPSKMPNAVLINEGRKLFFKETFNGNGRTCGTCHPAKNNFTHDPEYTHNHSSCRISECLRVFNLRRMNAAIVIYVHGWTVRSKCRSNLLSIASSCKASAPSSRPLPTSCRQRRSGCFQALLRWV